MMRKISTLTLSLLFCALLPIAARATEDTGAKGRIATPEVFQKTWVMAGCRKGKMAHTFSDFFVLTTIDNRNTLYRTEGVIAEPNNSYNIEMTGGAGHFIVGNKGSLFQTFTENGASFSIDELENHKLFIPHVRYSECPDNMPARIQVDQAIVSMMPRLDKIHENCPVREGATSTACQKSLVLLFDENGDTFLDKDEVRKAWDMIIKHNNFSQCAAAAVPTDILLADAGGYTKWSFDHLDQNKDELLSTEEIIPAWNIIQADAYMSGAINFLIGAADPLRILPEEAKLTCVNCCISTR